jgi:hypothetical protein
MGVRRVISNPLMVDMVEKGVYCFFTSPGHYTSFEDTLKFRGPHCDLSDLSEHLKIAGPRNTIE